MPSRRPGSSGDHESTRRVPSAGSTEDGGSDGSTDDVGATEKTAPAAAVTQPQAATELQYALPIRVCSQSSGGGDGTSAAPLDRRHRDRRAHTRRASHSQRNERRTGGRGQRSSGGGHRRRTSTLGPSTPRRSATQMTHPPNKGSRKLRSWLAAFAPTADKVPAHTTSRSRKGHRSGSSTSISTSTKADNKDTATTSKAAQPADAPKPPPRRLGKAELGKYANEDHMPDKVVAYLQNGWGVRREGIIPTLATLLEQSKKTEYAYLCDPCVQHVSRLPREGPFCGYRNIQTLYSYIISAGLPGHDRFGGALPSIFDVQDLIEEAWDKNFNAQGRIETGGVRGTRKYIGTPEAVAVFQSLGVPSTVRALHGKKPGGVQSQLQAEVQQYFAQGVRAAGSSDRVRRTRLPPIYWQQPGHSVTIVGLERTRAGDTNLLVLDPNYMQTPLLLVLLGGHRRATAHHPDRLLQAYRRSPQYVARFQATELLNREKKMSIPPKTSQQAVPDTTTAATKG